MNEGFPHLEKYVYIFAFNCNSFGHLENIPHFDQQLPFNVNPQQPPRIDPSNADIISFVCLNVDPTMSIHCSAPQLFSILMLEFMSAKSTVRVLCISRQTPVRILLVTCSPPKIHLDRCTINMTYVKWSLANVKSLIKLSHSLG